MNDQIRDIKIASYTNLCLSRLSLMVRDSNLIEEAMQLPNNSPHLRGEVASIHSRRAHSALVQMHLRRVEVYRMKEQSNTG